MDACSFRSTLLVFTLSDLGSLISDPDFGGLLLMNFLLNSLLVYLIYPHTKWGKKSTSKKDLKSKWEKFENSKEYEEILKNLN